MRSGCGFRVAYNVHEKVTSFCGIDYHVHGIYREIFVMLLDDRPIQLLGCSYQMGFSSNETRDSTCFGCPTGCLT